MKKKLNIINPKAIYKYSCLEYYIAGIDLLGTEIKSIRDNKADISESFCVIKHNELYVINMYIAEYQSGYYSRHNVKREKKLLLKKIELKKINKQINLSGITVIPTNLFINEKGIAKIKISLAKGKNKYDLRNYLLEKNIKNKINNYF